MYGMPSSRKVLVGKDAAATGTDSSRARPVRPRSKDRSAPARVVPSRAAAGPADRPGSGIGVSTGEMSMAGRSAKYPTSGHPDRSSVGRRTGPWPCRALPAEHRPETGEQRSDAWRGRVFAHQTATATQPGPVLGMPAFSPTKQLRRRNQHQCLACQHFRPPNSYGDATSTNAWRGRSGSQHGGPGPASATRRGPVRSALSSRRSAAGRSRGPAAVRRAGRIGEHRARAGGRDEP
ncbi:hypothetical protein SAMN05421854_103234 [Amycolatopsis rubida]|uniref:Uncharacterized protein n=1 Tax=Amycolatopsis rubida TaxID=112413 RepID=A0A1I5KL86_9PSEU|nr:hypothetical protein SAMN05421854_103234 [Amycolatopsis rubida]